jgi:hypothetical protein
VVQGIGRLCVALGLGLVVLGGLLWLFGGRLGWLGRLPGDIRIGDSIFVPITTCIVLSVVLTVVLNLLGRIFWR